MDNNNFFNEVDNSNNNPTSNPIQPTPINNLNSIPAQLQVNNGVSTTSDSINGQFNVQNNGNVLSNENVSEVSRVLQPTVDTTQQQINNINPMTQNNFQNNNIDSTFQSNLHSDNVNTIPPQNMGYPNQVITNTASTNDEELLKTFVGNNYDKITTRSFNFAGFFFTTFYMFYRKMFLYGILLFLVMLVVLNIVDNFIIVILFGVIVGLFVNKVYLYFANKKITKIKFQNQQKDINELKGLCLAKGGTSVGKIFLGFLAELGIAFIVLIVMLIAGIDGFIGEIFNLDNWNITINGNDINTNESDLPNNGMLIEDVAVVGYSCFSSTCYISIDDSNVTTQYLFDADNVELIKALSDYRDYIKLNIYYSQKEEEKTIVNYELFLKSTNENISNIKTEEELRTKIDLYNVGTHTATFTLTSTDEFSSVLKYCTFIDEKNNEYEMDYRNPDSTINLVVGNKYNVTFEVVKGTFDYEYNVISIK